MVHENPKREKILFKPRKIGQVFRLIFYSLFIFFFAKLYELLLPKVMVYPKEYRILKYCALIIMAVTILKLLKSTLYTINYKYAATEEEILHTNTFRVTTRIRWEDVKKVTFEYYKLVIISKDLEKIKIKIEIVDKMPKLMEVLQYNLSEDIYEDILDKINE